MMQKKMKKKQIELDIKSEKLDELVMIISTQMTKVYVVVEKCTKMNNEFIRLRKILTESLEYGTRNASRTVDVVKGGQSDFEDSIEELQLAFFIAKSSPNFDPSSFLTLLASRNKSADLTSRKGMNAGVTNGISDIRIGGNGLTDLSFVNRLNRVLVENLELKVKSLKDDVTLIKSDIDRIYDHLEIDDYNTYLKKKKNINELRQKIELTKNEEFLSDFYSGMAEFHLNNK